MIFLWWIQCFPSFLSTFLPHFLSLQLLTLLSLGAYWHFPANLLFYAHLNVCCLIRCAGGLEFHPTSLPTLLLSSGLFIPPSCALKVKLPFTKPLRSYLGDPATPQSLQQPVGENRDHSSLERKTTGLRCAFVPVCVCQFSAIRAIYLLPNCPNTCDNIQWFSSRVQYSRDSADAAQHGVKLKTKASTNSYCWWNHWLSVFMNWYTGVVP